MTAEISNSRCVIKGGKVSSKSWQSYEEVAQYLLNKFADHFELGHVEGKQDVENAVTLAIKRLQ